MYVYAFIWVGVFFLLAPLALGLVHTLRARVLARRGPRVWQPYLDAWKLLHKGVVIPRGATMLYVVGPIVAFTCSLLLGYLIPIPLLLTRRSLQGALFLGADVVMAVYLLGLARFIMALAVWDVGAPFGALGSSRQFFFQALAEPTFLIALYTLTTAYRTSNILLFTQVHRPWSFSVALLIALFALIIVFLAEGGRLPFDSPDTHLELTMVEGGPALSYSGPLWLLLEWGAAMRLFFFLLFLAYMTVISLRIEGGYAAAGALVLVFLLFVVALSVGETYVGKLRLRRVVAPFAMALILAIISLLIMAVLVNTLTG